MRRAHTAFTPMYFYLKIVPGLSFWSVQSAKNKWIPGCFFPVDFAGRVTSGSMTSEHRQSLIQNRAVLINDMDASLLISYLFSKEVINTSSKQEIEAKPTTIKKNEALLDCLPGRGDKAFFVFCEALQREAKQTHLVELLTRDTVQGKDRCVVS